MSICSSSVFRCQRTTRVPALTGKAGIGRRPGVVAAQVVRQGALTTFSSNRPKELSSESPNECNDLENYPTDESHDQPGRDGGTRHGMGPWTPVQSTTKQRQRPAHSHFFRYVFAPQGRLPSSALFRYVIFPSGDPSPSGLTSKEDAEARTGPREFGRAKILEHPRVLRALARDIERMARRNQQVLSKKGYMRELFVRSTSLHPLTTVDPSWPRAYFQLFNDRYHQQKTEAEIWEDIPLRNKEMAYEWVREIVPSGRAKPEGRAQTVALMAATWRKMPRSDKAARWAVIMQWLLLHSHRDALNFLAATNQAPYPHFNMVANCFLYLEAIHYDDLARGLGAAPFYRRVLHSCLNPRRWPMVGISQRGIRVLLKRCDDQDVAPTFSTILEQNITTSAETLLYFMDHFTRLGDVENALHALRLVPQQKNPPTDLSSGKVLNRCSNLLKLDEVVDVDGVRNFKILPKILDIGIQPDRDIMNLVLSNVLKTGDSQMGWDILEYMKEQGFVLDSYTYVALMKEAITRGDVEKLDIVFRDLERNEGMKCNTHVTSQTLHAFYTLDREGDDPSKPYQQNFSRMLEIYGRAHDLTPLQDLGIIRRSWQPLEQGPATPPSQYALNIMIAAYLRNLNDRADGGAIFDRFQDLVAQGNEHFGPLAESDYTHNIFLMSFLHESHTLPNCIKVVESMLQPLPSTAILKTEDKHMRRRIRQAKPTVRTWTILLSAFMFQGQLQAVEKVKAMMTKHGVQFNDVTWNIMISGYAKLQMVKETATTLRSREEQLLPVDAYTVRAVQRLRDSERLGDALDVRDE